MPAAAVAPAAAGEPVADRVQGRVAAFRELTKPRITMLVLITCAAAMVIAQEGLPPLLLLLAALAGLGLSSGGASALNHVWDRDIDARMRRTARRPVVTGVVGPREGAAFGLALLGSGTALLWTATTPVAALLSLFGGAFYVLVYTMLLKRRTVHNTVVGGIAGAMPPLVGWAALTGDLASPVPWTLFAVMFLWQPPHFWALSLLIHREYAGVGVPMLPVVAGERATVRQTWWYVLALVVTTLVPVATGNFGVVYLASVVALDVWLLLRAWRLVRAARRAPDAAERATFVAPASPGHTAARGLFLASLLWLALVFVAAVVDAAVVSVPLLP